MNVCVHTYICIDTYTYVSIKIRKYTHTCIHICTYIHTYIPAYIHACMHAYIHTYIALPRHSFRVCLFLYNQAAGDFDDMDRDGAHSRSDLQMSERQRVATRAIIVNTVRSRPVLSRSKLNSALINERQSRPQFRTPEARD